MLGDIETYTLSELDLRRELAGQQTRSAYGMSMPIALILT